MGIVELLVILLMAVLFLALIAFAARHFGTARAKIGPATPTDDAQLSRHLHEETLKTQQQIISEIAELKSRIGNIEKLLREVE